MNLNTDVFLAVIAAALVVQVLLLVASLAWARGAARRAGERLDRVERELRPRLESLTDGFARVTDSVSSLSDDAQRQLAQVESAVVEATGRVRSTGETVGRVTHHPAGLLAAALALTIVRRFTRRRPLSTPGGTVVS
jgi:hypothetical protein